MPDTPTTSSLAPLGIDAPTFAPDRYCLAISKPASFWASAKARASSGSIIQSGTGAAV